MDTKNYGPFITLLTVIICIFVSEYLLYKLRPVPDPYEKWKHSISKNQYIRSEYPPNFSIITKVEDGLPGMQGQNSFSTNNLGFRGDSIILPKPDTEYRIFMIGGSTTDNFYLHDTLNVTAILQDYLQSKISDQQIIKVYNAGKSGDASDDHISMLVHRIVHLNPDMIILFCGINDLGKSIHNFDYLHFIKERIIKTPMLKGLATEFQIPRRFYYLLKQVVPDNKDIIEEITYRSNYIQKIGLTNSYSITSEKPKLNLEAYRNNLLTIVGIAKSHEFNLVFMTQQTTWDSPIDKNTSDWHWMTLRNGKRFSETNLNLAMDSLNNVMRQISSSNLIPLYDLAVKFPKTVKYFYDDVHFNQKGAKTAAIELGKLILSEKLIPDK